MGIFGVDVSNYQTSFDFTGWDFAILKASEGSGFKDRMFPTHLANARRAGCVIAAYHYVRLDPAAYQVGNIESVVPKDVPVILDIEDGAGSDPNHWRQLINELRERGYSVPLVYIPRWYWNKIGQPDLSGFPPLWMSWYPDYVARPREQGIAKVPASAWAPMDGVPVIIMQFTSSPFDQNYFAGSKDELASLFNGDDMDYTWLQNKLNEERGYRESGDRWVRDEVLATVDARFAELKANNAEILAAIAALGTTPVNVEAVAEKAKQKIVEDLND